MAVFAADGQLSFSDPTAKVGEEITVNMKVKSDTPLARVDITLRYDSNALQFISGTNTDGGAGTLRVHGTGDNSVANTLAFALKFKAASAGQSSITVEKQEIYSGDESLLNLTHVGKGAVNITAEETSSESAAESSSSAEESEETETKNEGVKLTAKDKSITIMNPGSDVKIPDGFWESTIDVDGHQVKGWVWKADTEHQYIIVYGMNDAGDLHFYRYDLKEKTIQRYFQDPLEAEQKKNAESYPTLLNQYDKTFPFNSLSLEIDPQSLDVKKKTQSQALENRRNSELILDVVFNSPLSYIEQLGKRRKRRNVKKKKQ